MARRPHWIRMDVVGLCDGNGCRASQQAMAVSWVFGRCGLGCCDGAVHFSHRSGLLWLALSLLEPGLQVARRPHWLRMGVDGLCDDNGCRAPQLACGLGGCDEAVLLHRSGRFSCPFTFDVWICLVLAA